MDHGKARDSKRCIDQQKIPDASKLSLIISTCFKIECYLSIDAVWGLRGLTSFNANHVGIYLSR